MPVTTVLSLATLISTVMKDGKKSLAERIVYAAIEKTREDTDTVDPLEIVNKAMENVKPRLEVKSRRVGGATYQVPLEVPLPPGLPRHALDRRVTPTTARHPDAGCARHELKDAAAGQGNAIKKRDDTHKMAQANRAFAHFRW